MKTKKLVRMALLTAIALVIFVAEAQIPVPVPIPGLKLGLANIITVYAMFTVGPAGTLMILLVRILLSSIFTGQALSLLYSLGGGLVCYLVMLALRRALSLRQIWVCGVLGAIAHNAGQILVAIAVTRTPAIAAYFPVLTLAAVITGLITGTAAQLLVNRLGEGR
jgi:heptaprenyl diphosphate synthase